MTDFRERYKRLGFDPDENRALRSHRRDEARRGIRDEQMSLRREMGDVHHDDSLLEEETTASTQPSVSGSGYSQECSSVGDSHEAHQSKAEAEYEAAVEHRWERLQKWRVEKNKRKQIEKKKAKPVFKVGVVHHRIYSPSGNKEVAAAMPPPKLCKSKDMSAILSQTAQPKRVTRATEKRLAVKAIVNQKKRENTRNKKKAQAEIHNPSNEDNQVEIAPKDHMFKAPLGVTPMIFGRQALEATRANIKAEIDSFHISAAPITPSFSESFNESSLSLKMSSDDQEMLDDSPMKEAKSPVSRRSSKNHSPPAADVANSKGFVPNDEEMREVEQISKTEKRNSGFVEKTESPKVATPKGVDTSTVQDNKTPSRKRKSIAAELPKEVAVDSPRRTRSTRATGRRRSVRIASTDSADSGIEPSFTPEESSVKVADSETDSISTPGKQEKPSRRRSSKIVADEIAKSVSTPPKKRRSTKLISSGSTDKEDDTFARPAASRRRSTRIVPEKDNLNSSSIVTVADVHQSPLASQEPNIPIKSPPRKKSLRFTTHDQENLDFNSTNLMDFTFSAPAKPPKLLDPPKTLLDDTVSNLSPRRSSRLPTGPTVVNPDEDQPLIRFSSFYVPPPTGNESSSSEPTKQRSPNEMLNLSLDMSLPEDDVERPPAYFSPYIVQSRGKNSARKEMKKRRFSQPGLEGEDIPTKDNIMQKLNISAEEEARTAQYYKHILGNEIERLNEVCERWNAIKEDPATPEENRYIIQAAVGQTQLLINKKFVRFRSLVQDCETGRGEMLVTCKDLQGFWEMMYMEINDCDGRFNKLEEMKANNWVEKEDEAAVKEVEKKKKKPPAKKPAAKKPAAGGNKPSSLRAMIAAARKKKAEVEGGEGPAPESTEKSAEQANDTEKPSTPTKSTSRHSSTPRSGSKWDTLLKKVQLSQTRRSTTSPLVVMKLGQMVKTPEVQLDDSIVYINSARTPAKSILKKDEVMGSVSKSTNKVFFREQPNEVKEFEIRNSFVDENMSLDSIEEVKEPIERRLNFEDESFVENTEEKGQSVETTSSTSQFVSSPSASSLKKSRTVTLTTSPMISLSPLSLEDKKSPRSATKSKPAKTKKQISFKEVGDDSELSCSRTKKFSAPLTPRPKRRNQEDIEEDMIVEVDDSAHTDTPGPKMVKEIYLNEQGVVCERLVPVKKDTPARSKLKRSNSESTQRSRKGNKTLELDELNNTPSTPRLTRRNTNVPNICLTTPNATTKEIAGKKQSLKRSFADTTLTQDSVDVSMEETTPKLSKRTPKATKTKSETLSSPAQSPKPTLKRTRSLKVANNEENAVKKTATPKLRRTKSLSVKEVRAEDSPKEALNRKSLKKLQENTEPNQQETVHSTKEKLPRTPSIKRKSSKEKFENIEQSEKLTHVSDALSDTMTPNTRRKSLRITRASVKDGI